MIQQDQYTRALERAHANGLMICARGWLKQDGSRVVGVTSASQANTVHMVVVRDLVLSCDCEAAKHDRFCQHRALVHEFLVSERFDRIDARISKLEQDVHRVALQVVKLSNQSHGEDAPLVSASKPFSIFKK